MAAAADGARLGGIVGHLAGKGMGGVDDAGDGVGGDKRSESLGAAKTAPAAPAPKSDNPIEAISKGIGGALKSLFGK